MKRNKKVLVALVVAASTIAFAGCGSDKKEDTNKATEKAVVQEQTSEKEVSKVEPNEKEENKENDNKKEVKKDEQSKKIDDKEDTKTTEVKKEEDNKVQEKSSDKKSEEKKSEEKSAEKPKENREIKKEEPKKVVEQKKAPEKPAEKKVEPKKEEKKVEIKTMYKDGTYTGSAKGFNGDITVNVTISGDKITAVDVVSATDDEPYISNAKAVTSSIVSNQSANVSAVSGATFSSTGIINAAANAISQAKN